MKRSLFGAVALAAVALTVVFIGSAGAKPPAPNNSCPTSIKNIKLADNVAAYFTTNGDTATYWFVSTDPNEVTVNGVPGLVKYCVYTNNAPDSVEANYDAWTASAPGKTFAFSRPGGESTNIPFTGSPTDVGEATWTGSVPDAADQTLVVHISDAGVCKDIYGKDTPTCFVLPGPKPGPICDAGDTSLAYNAIPTDIYNGCPPLDSYSFEGQVGTKEFGDEVQLAGSGTTIESLNVPFVSWGCGTSGHWNTGDCVTTGNPTFTIPDNTSGDGHGGLHAVLYSVGANDTLGSVLGTAVGTTGIGTNQDEMPFRPSWDQAKCLPSGTDANGGDDTGKWYDAASNLCLNGYPFPVTFDFSDQDIAVPLDGKVIWTVWFDTTSSGRFPLGALACRTDNGGDPGCGYDSLNVADWTFTNAPTNDAYAGTDVDPAAQWIDRGTGLAPEGGNTGLRPDAQIITG